MCPDAARRCSYSLNTAQYGPDVGLERIFSLALSNDSGSDVTACACQNTVPLAALGLQDSDGTPRPDPSR
jgi:hypothetical protein